MPPATPTQPQPSTPAPPAVAVPPAIPPLTPCAAPSIAQDTAADKREVATRGACSAGHHAVGSPPPIPQKPQPSATGTVLPETAHAASTAGGPRVAVGFHRSAGRIRSRPVQRRFEQQSSHRSNIAASAVANAATNGAAEQGVPEVRQGGPSSVAPLPAVGAAMSKQGLGTSHIKQDDHVMDDLKVPLDRGPPSASPRVQNGRFIVISDDDEAGEGQGGTSDAGQQAALMDLAPQAEGALPVRNLHLCCLCMK